MVKEMGSRYIAYIDTLKLFTYSEEEVESDVIEIYRKILDKPEFFILFYFLHQIG